MTSKNLNFIHRFIPSSKNSEEKYDNYSNDKDNLVSKNPATLLLLHGTGGNEDDLIPLGRLIYPNANLLSPRGKVLEHGMPRFFKRLAEGVFDIEDLKFRTQELAKFVNEASLHYSFDLSKTIAVGFSNGANIAASLLLLYPQVIAGAVLFRPMIPIIPNNLPNLSEKKIVILSGQYDPIVSKKQAEDLFSLLKKTDAKVTIQWQESGHEITQDDVQIAKKWLSENF
ncbi:MAG TPA: alpha/beta hydrolase [Bacillus sp. (in: firmicutes)]|nr:alpha/beta hydrolase [Bacillus sp. (in: firmicutes)]